MSHHLKNFYSRLAVLSLTLFSAGNIHAGLITTVGDIDALTDISQLAGDLFVADLNDGTTGARPEADRYAAQGLTLYQGALADALPGVTASGSSLLPFYRDQSIYFPGPIAGGGGASGLQMVFGPVATFDIDITQFGLTASQNGTQYMTVWNTLGGMIGQLTWTPDRDSSFIGLDTRGVNIGMIAYGNDNLWAGESYNVSGATIMSDNWVWAVSSVPEPESLALLGIGLLGLVISRRRKVTSAFESNSTI